MALCGRPNVGKSSLLNALLGEDRAIVTDIPGTTRDTVSGELTLDGVVVRLTDTAGLRETDDPVESIGIGRARQAVAESDAVLLLLDAHEPLTEEDRRLLKELAGPKLRVVLNKSDLPAAVEPEQVEALCGRAPIEVSAHQPGTLLPLRETLTELARVDDRLALTQPRHLAAARRAAQHLRDAAQTLRSAPVDLAAIDLAAAQDALAEVTGDRVEERLLDEVFSRFCVGK